jgi:glycosyltransferase involved in cell wall biosynthesis
VEVLWAYDRDHRQHPFIVLSANSLKAAGLGVTVVSGDYAPGAPYAAWNDFSMQRRFDNWAAVADGPPLARLLGRLRYDTIDLWALYARGFRRLMALPADVIVASRPEAAVVAFLVARLRRKRFVYFPFELYGEQITKAQAWLLWAERLILARADAVITQNALRARVYVEERGARTTPFLVHNYKTTQPARRGGKLRPLLGLPAKTRIVLYEGLLIPGRWLDRLAQSVLHLPQDVAVVLMGREKMGWRAQVAEALAPALATGRLFILPSVSHDDLPDYVADADAGVVIYDDAVRNNLYCEPGKLTDYLSVGVPVLTPDFPTVGPLVRDLKVGATFGEGSPQAIAAAALQVLARSGADWRPALDSACAKLNWESQTPALLEAVTGSRQTVWAQLAPPGADG